MAEFNPQNRQEVIDYLANNAKIYINKGYICVADVLGAFAAGLAVDELSLLSNDEPELSTASVDKFKPERPDLSLVAWLDDKREQKFEEDIDQALMIANQGVTR